MKDADALNAVAYGPEWSARWEAEFGDQPDTQDAADYLAGLANGRAVLELGIGTGRLALPLLDRGLAVTGVDNSPWMIEQLRAKPRGDEIHVVEGDFADVKVDGEFGLAFISRFALSALTTQEAQVQCFENVAAHLAPGGFFVVELLAPASGVLENGRAWTSNVKPDAVSLFVSTANHVTQEMRTCHIRLSETEGVQLRPGAVRYVWPSELDLMARIAGMRLHERWSSWDKAPFTTTSTRNITAYRKA
ncbi:class I SAM-dependent DNA methyltransferase [Nonomuraea candida]|uniref:class I SAM-dependent DNA methyltransferase n=1 Tax=Nonomuraea candida TaxID=359159 RepID=UPI0005BA04A6|nr:class I SAM-dependent methyltransferase [Nonomuraea candida]